MHKTSLYCLCNFGLCVDCYCNCLQVLKHAENGYRPQRSHICEINVQGCLSDGTVVDAHDHLTVQIGDTEVSMAHRNMWLSWCIGTPVEWSKSSLEDFFFLIFRKNGCLLYMF